MRRTACLLFCLLAIAALPSFAQQCDPGYAGPGGMQPCTACEVGFYSAVSGAEFCEACPAGRYQPLEGSDHCLDCPEGTYQPNPGGAECLVCPDGFIAPFTGSAECIPCAEGTTSNATHTECVPDPVPGESMPWSLLKAGYR